MSSTDSTRNPSHSAKETSLFELTPQEQLLLKTKPADLPEDQRVARRKLQNRLASSVCRSKKREGYNALAVASNNLAQNIDDCKATIKMLRGQVNDLLRIASQLGGMHQQQQQQQQQPPRMSSLSSIFKYNISDPNYSPSSVCTDLQAMGIRADLLSDSKSSKARLRISKSTSFHASTPSMLDGEDQVSLGTDFDTQSYSSFPSLSIPSASSKKPRSPNPSIAADTYDVSSRFDLKDEQAEDPINVPKRRTGPIRRSSRRLVAPVCSAVQEVEQPVCDEIVGTTAATTVQPSSKRSRARHTPYPEDKNLQIAPPIPHSESQYPNYTVDNQHTSLLRSGLHDTHTYPPTHLLPVPPIMPYNEYNGIPVTHELPASNPLSTISEPPPPPPSTNSLYPGSSFHLDTPSLFPPHLHQHHMQSTNNFYSASPISPYFSSTISTSIPISPPLTSLPPTSSLTSSSASTPLHLATVQPYHLLHTHSPLSLPLQPPQIQSTNTAQTLQQLSHRADTTAIKTEPTGLDESQLTAAF